MLNLIVAPTNVCKKAEKITKTIVKFLKREKVDYSVFFSISLEDLAGNVKRLSNAGETDFIAVGDDKILNVIINSVKDITKLKLGIIPVGSHDDFAQYLEISNKPIQAIKDILENNIESVDYMQVNDMNVLNNVVIGATVEAEQAYGQYKIKNRLTQRLAMLSYGNKFEGVELVLEHKGTKHKKENIYELILANGGTSKKKPISPLSNTQDGLFNLIYVGVGEQKINRNFISKMKKGEHIHADNVKQFWLDSIRITNSDNKVKALIDGIVLNLEAINVTMVEKGLKLFKKKN